MQPPKDFTHGEIVRWRRVGGLLLAEVVYAPGQRIPQHVHANVRFVLVLQGALTEARGDETRSYGASTLLFRCAGEAALGMWCSPRQGATCLVVVTLTASGTRRVRRQARRC